jgi:hypothetical protein
VWAKLKVNKTKIELNIYYQMANSIFPKVKEYATSASGVLMAVAAILTAVSAYYRPTDNKKYEAEITALNTRVSQLNVQQYETQLKVNSFLEWKTKIESNAKVDAEITSSTEKILLRNLTKKYGASIAKDVLKERQKLEKE